MRAAQQRTFIALDEWLGILVAIFLFERGSALFWPFTVIWAVAVYVISYPLHWGWWQMILARYRATSEVDERRCVVQERQVRPVGVPS